MNARAAAPCCIRPSLRHPADWLLHRANPPQRRAPSMRQDTVFEWDAMHERHGLRWRPKRETYPSVANQTHTFALGLSHRRGKYGMNVSIGVAEWPRAADTTDFDAIIIGAGISGMFMLYRL